MTGADWLLLFKFLVEGIGFIKKFIKDEEVRNAFNELKKSQTDAEKQEVAKKMATLIYNR